METGRFQINVTPEDADVVYVSESGPPDPAKAAKLSGRVYETAAPAVWFLADDSKGIAAAFEWRAPVRVRLDVKRVSGGHRIALAAIPRAAMIRATFDGSDPRQGAEVAPGESDAPNGAKQLRVVAEVDGVFGQEESVPLGGGLEEGPAGGDRPAKPKASPKLDAPALLASRFEPKETASAFSALDRLAKIPEAKVYGGSVELNGQTDALGILFRLKSWTR